MPIQYNSDCLVLENRSVLDCSGKQALNAVPEIKESVRSTVHPVEKEFGYEDQC